MSAIPKHFFKPNDKNQHTFDQIRRATGEKSQRKHQSKTIFRESTGARRCAKNEIGNYVGDTALRSSQNNAIVKSSTGKRKDVCGDEEDSDSNSSSISLMQHLSNFRKLRKCPRKTRNSESSVSKDKASDSTLTDIDVSSSDGADGLSTSSILELYDATLRSDDAKLKKVQTEIKRNYTSCFIRQELVTIATMCSTRAKDFFKPFPHIFMVNNEPCYEELKVVLKNFRSLKAILSSKNKPLLENRILLDVLHWTFFESKLPAFIEIQFSQALSELQKIDVLRLPVRPSLITKAKYAHYSNQEVDHRHVLKYLKQNGEDFEIKMGFIAVHMQLLYQVLTEGVDLLIRDKRGMPIYTNFIASIDSIRDNVYYLMNSNYNNGSNIVFEYCAILIMDIVIRKHPSRLNSKDELTVYRNTYNSNDCIYYIKNVKMIKTKFIFFFKMGSSKMLRKLVSIDKKMHAKYTLSGQRHSPHQNCLMSHKRQHHRLALSIALNIVAILLSFICFIWFMKTCLYF